MSWCSALENPSFVELSSLEKVDSHWMSNSDTLADPHFDGLSSLGKVGPDGHKKVRTRIFY